MKGLVLILLIFFNLNLPAKTYQIIQTKGIVKMCNDKTLLLQGDKINSITGICLINKKDTIAAVGLIDIDNGARFILRQNKLRKNELFPILAPRGTNIETRIENFDDEINMLRSRFGSGKRNIISGNNTMKLKYAANGKFVTLNAYYKYNGKWVKKYLSISNQRLTINRAKIFTVDGVPINPNKISEVKMYYWDKNRTDKAVAIASFQPNYLSENAIKRELDILLSTLGSKLNLTHKDKMTKSLEYLHYFYGDMWFPGNYEWIESYISKKGARQGAVTPKKKAVDAKNKSAYDKRKEKAKKLREQYEKAKEKAKAKKN